jgi:hypothetical protein
MNLSAIPLAFKFVAVTLMLMEINYCVKRLHLPVNEPITAHSLKTIYIAHPYISGFGGTLGTTNYLFIFSKDGRLRRIQRINKFEKLPLDQLQERLSHMKSLIDTNGAYKLATNWLSEMSIDTDLLEKAHPHSVEQRFFYPGATSFSDLHKRSSNITLLPVFHVYWGDKRDPSVFISIFGPTKEMLYLGQNDDSYSRRPKELVKNMQSLLAIPDDKFESYSLIERSNLVAQFSAVNYTNVDSELSVLMSDTNNLVLPAALPSQ